MWEWGAAVRGGLLCQRQSEGRGWDGELLAERPEHVGREWLVIDQIGQDRKGRTAPEIRIVTGPRGPVSWSRASWIVAPNSAITRAMNSSRVGIGARG